MADEVTGGGEPVAVKVVDRRRFRSDGEATGGDPAEATAESAPKDGGGASPAGASAEALAELMNKNAQLAARIDELTRAYAALVEDNKAFRSRMEREKARVLEAEQTRVVQALLCTADELERALAAVTGVSASSDGMLDTLAQGVRLTLSGLTKRISELGAERLVVVGQRFDPHVAEAIDMIPVSDVSQDEQVLEELCPGYRMGERILRPARVRVGRVVRT